MKADDLILLALLANDNNIKGKTYLQKSLYFIEKRVKTDLRFIPHYYGPYSPDINSELSNLIAIGMINEKEEDLGIINSHGFERKRFDYDLMPAGEKMAKRIAAEYKDEWIGIKKFFSELKELGNIDYMDLSLAAKAFYLIERERKSLTPEEIKQKAESLNWPIDESSSERAINILKKLGFTEKSNR
jgi:hypothetical protein